MLTTYVCLMNYKNGITVPNMIGAYYNFNNSIDLSSSQCVVNVLNDILASQKSISVLINKCTNVNNYILSVLEKTDPRHPNINERIFVNMYDSNLKKCLCDVNELGENLKKAFVEHLHNCPNCHIRFNMLNSIVNDLKNKDFGILFLSFSFLPFFGAFPFVWA